MDFKFTIAMLPLTVEFEAGSISEGVSILQAETTTLSSAYTEAKALVASVAAAESGGGGAPPAGEATTAPEGPKTRKPRGSNKNQPDLTTVTAPPPIAPPGAPAAPAVDTGIPPFLQRGPDNAPPQLPPSAAPSIAPPPAAPAPLPPSGVLAGKIVANLKLRADASADGGKELVNWLATAGIVIPGCTFEEALAVINMKRDDELKLVADSLQVS